MSQSPGLKPASSPPRPSPPISKTRSRSRSPRLDDDSIHPSRRRSRSRTPPRKPKSYSGLKWKKTERREDDEREDKGLRRGYRAQEEDRRREDERRRRDRSRDRDERFGDRGGRGDYGRRDTRDRHDSRYGRQGGDDREAGFGRGRNRFEDGGDRRNRDRDSDRPQADRKPKERRADKSAPAAAPAGSGEPMIIVTVNDRLGTKAQIPCMASDPVKVFKAMVAARIGRAPHEIMLKRQGERPFKDFMTLEDYGVSNGVQLDLELDTGD